ncbi:MAG: hypothetical protein GWN84_11710 [Gammaproteobacteria bacterium]|nr:hypothetical protein [Gammaproteobacteria bacterium]NIR83533.1 hypothetical protein [Gammaproteobacteria bacterium]NIR91455.1 hypothetical protein [Gammaproteobacteria bacterium]NIU04695.1 hypothetical protein [Gammaproteobacteria bacterium]NIV51737.1 hypothetical protein [Gammaproteobacteria bacterium]
MSAETAEEFIENRTFEEIAVGDAVSDVARSLTGLESEVAGKADVLVVPDLETGSMLAEQLRHLGDAHAAGVILGARVPIVSVGPGDDGIGTMASCALALLRARRPQTPSVRHPNATSWRAQGQNMVSAQSVGWAEQREAHPTRHIPRNHLPPRVPCTVDGYRYSSR